MFAQHLRRHTPDSVSLRRDIVACGHRVKHAHEWPKKAACNRYANKATADTRHDILHGDNRRHALSYTARRLRLAKKDIGAN